MHAIALAAGKLANFFLLVAPLEVEGSAIGPTVHFGLAELQNIGAARNLFPHRLVGIESIAGLVDITYLHGVSDAQDATIGLFLASEQAKERRLAGAIGTDDADDTARRQLEVHILEQETLAIGLGEAFGLDHDAAQSFADRNENLRRPLTLLLRAGQQIFVGIDAGLGLGLPRLGRARNPFPFAGQARLAGFGLFAFLQQTLFLLGEKANPMLNGSKAIFRTTKPTASAGLGSVPTSRTASSISVLRGNGVAA